MEKKYFIIIGASSMNTGSLNMLFSTVYELKLRFPQEIPVVLSNYEYKMINSTTGSGKDYAFEVLPDYLLDFAPFPYRSIKKIANCFGIGTKSGPQAPQWDRFKEVINHAIACIDISGYSLHSDVKHPINSVRYCINIATFKKNGIPVWLFPQSFGPFEYKGLFRPVMRYLMRKYLSYPKLIFCREKDGIECLKPYGLNNVMRGIDTVLLSRTPTFQMLYKEGHIPQNIILDKEEVLKIVVIPSNIVYQKMGRERFIALYAKVFDYLSEKYNVYVIAHSILDKPVCLELEEQFSDKRINWIIEDLDPIEMEGLLEQFDLCITSRFHGALHCYKHSVPCVVVGWASKYEELMLLFGQEKYLFDIRKECNDNEVVNLVREILPKLDEEKERIGRGLGTTENIFDIFEKQIIRDRNTK